MSFQIKLHYVDTSSLFQSKELSSDAANQKKYYLWKKEKKIIFALEKPVCTMLMSYQTVLFRKLETYLTIFRSEKLLVVLLVASATVCFLTNLLVLLILSLSTQRKYNRGRRVKLMLRYQLMRNQAIIGLFTASVVVYPLKVSHKNVRCKIASYYRVSKTSFGDRKL